MPLEFEAAFAHSKAAACERALSEHTALQTKASSKGKARMGKSFGQALQRRLALWSSAQPRAKLSGLILDGDRIATSPSDISAGLSAHWSKAFRWRGADPSAMESLSAHAPAFPLCPPPPRASASSVVRRAKNNAPGHDGIPAAGWLAVPSLSADLCWDSFLWLCAGRWFPSLWHSSLVVFPPKKPPPGAHKVHKRAKETRPISLKLVCNKHVMMMISWSLRLPLRAWTSPSQRGFVPGRALTWNVVEADARCRQAGFANPSQHPCALALDIEAAFPSLSRQWITFCLTRIGIPEGLLRTIVSTHHNCWALAATDTGLAYTFELACGIQQGCPMASVIFILCFDAAVRACALIVGTLGWVFACADDVFIIVLRAALLTQLSALFSLIRAATALQLNAPKCVVVPLWAHNTMHTTSVMKDVLLQFAPLWARAPVAGFATFLGFPVGPGASADDPWTAPLAKLMSRSREIFASGASPSLAGALLQQRGIAALTYVAQFTPPPPGIIRTDVQVLSRVLRAPGIFICRQVAAHMQAIFKISCSLPSATCWAALLRARVSTFAPLAPIAAELHAHAEQHLSLSLFHQGLRWPPFWKSRCIASALISDFRSSCSEGSGPPLMSSVPAARCAPSAAPPPPNHPARSSVFYTLPSWQTVSACLWPGTVSEQDPRFSVFLLGLSDPMFLKTLLGPPAPTPSNVRFARP